VSIGADIKAVYEEIGSSITFIRDSGNVSGEYIDSEIAAQATKPFIREYFRNANFSHVTSGEVGDIFSFDSTGELYMIMNLSPDIFENEVIEYNAVVYKANVSGELKRPSGEVWDAQTYQKTAVFKTIKPIAYGLYTSFIYGNEQITESDFAEYGIQHDQAYFPISYGIKVDDRYEPVSGEYYKVTSIQRRQFPGHVVVDLAEDSR